MSHAFITSVKVIILPQIFILKFTVVLAARKFKIKKYLLSAVPQFCIVKL